ncbi:MAG: bifunctional demethylmenaquinone methyltransferase/2-methoxy-6-polyprenyl-1,4-benzoquinol methylase UbiE [Acidobacteria bacterium]|nr:bifunctional demethylmenaquinone methyltransferase/2-methoxy-6-polyprenyl-1,4-benzoquinol methylase UbiE [Acidobacteriota bacterium]
MIRSPDEKSRRVREMFAGIARRYDFLNHFLSLGTDIYWRKRVFRRMTALLDGADGRILDLCCGTGDLALELARRWKVVGCDFCHPMLVLAGQKLVRRGNGRQVIRLAEGDALQLPFADASFLAVTVAFGVRNFADIDRGLREIRRVLRPGGVLGVLEFSHPVVPVFRGIFRFYFQRILPRLGHWVSGDRSAYTYLPASVGDFPAAEPFREMLQVCGFVETAFERFTGGVAALHVGRRPSLRGNEGPVARERADENEAS